MDDGEERRINNHHLPGGGAWTHWWTREKISAESTCFFHVQ